jgi:hypothetical protein
LPKFDDAYSFKNGISKIKIGAKYGFITKENFFCIEPKYVLVDLIAKNIIRTKYDIDFDYKFGLIDINGSINEGSIFDCIMDFSEDFAPVKIGINWGYMDVEGKMSITPKFSYADNFNDGLAKVKK